MKKRGLFIVQLPPPVHGVSTMNARVINDARLHKHLTIDVLRLAYSERLSELNVATAGKLVRWAKLLLTLFRSLLFERPDFVYFTPVPTGTQYVRDLPFMLLIKAFRVPLILHMHGRGIAERASRTAWRILYRVGLRHCAIVSASPEMRDRELAPLRLRKARLHVVPNTVDRVDVDRFRCLRQRPRELRLLFLSSTFPFKGVFVLLDSILRLQQRGVMFDVDIVGSSTEEHDTRIREFVTTHDLRRVRVLGALFGADKYSALASADVLVHPTLNDYSPLVILEAMQFGLAIVSTRIGAIPEMVEQDVHGSLVRSNDADALALAIERMIAAPEQVRAMGAASRCRYLQRYSPEQFSTALLDVLRSERLLESAR